MKRFAQRIFLAFALIWLPATGQAQPFPTGPINVVVPLAPGDAADTRHHRETAAARHFAELRRTQAGGDRYPRGVQAGERDGQEDRIGLMTPVAQAPKGIYCSRAAAAARASGTTS